MVLFTVQPGKSFHSVQVWCSLSEAGFFTDDFTEGLSVDFVTSMFRLQHAVIVT